jgi:hypothetical protein
MDELKTEFVQERNSGPRKGFYYNSKLGGYSPAQGKGSKPKTEGNKRKLIILVTVGIIGILAYLFRDKLKALMLKKSDNGN